MAEQPPLEPIGEVGMGHDPVVDFASYRVRAGRTPFTARKCEHNSVLYCTRERRVWCDDCKSSIDAFDAFLNIVRHFEEIVAEIRAAKRMAEEALRSVIVRRAAKEIDRTWGAKMAPCCPHCRRGLLPQDFADGMSAVGRDYEEAARRMHRSTAPVTHGDGANG